MKSNELSRREFLRLSGLAAAGMALAGCVPVTPVSETAKPAATAVPAEPEPLTISYWLPGCDMDCTYPQVQWSQDYAEMNPGVAFETTGPPWQEYWVKLPLNIAAGTGPDMWRMHNAWTQQFVDGGLMEAWPDEDVAEIRELCTHVDLHVIDGKLYYWDQGLMTGLIFYNKKLWEEAGLSDADIPKSWPQLVEIAKELTVYNSAGEVERAGFNWGHTTVRWMWIVLKYQLGEFLFTSDGRRGLINTEGAREAAQTILDWEFSDRIGSTDLPGAGDALVSELAVMAYSWGHVANWLKSNHPELDVGIFALPSLDGEPAPCYDRNNGNSTSTVNPQASPEKKRVCFDFIKWYATDPDKMRELAKGGVAPVVKSLKDDPEALAIPVVAASLEQIDRTIWPGTPPNEWVNALDVLMDPVFIARSGTVEEALPDCQAAMNEALSKSETVYWGYQERLYTHADEMFEPELVD